MAGEWVLDGRYRVVDRLGAGGMAEVFRAHDQLLDRDVAVKVYRHAAEPADSVERPQAELQALARLSHPNLITLFDAGLSPAGGPAFLVMELVEGPTLAERLAAGALPESEVRDVGAQIAEALDYIHRHGMVHRDVKPANILLGNDGVPEASRVRARLSDFGIVRLLGSARLTEEHSTIGTACYLAPEQARGAEVGPAADIYALGLVLIEALSGERAYDGPPLQAAMARLLDPPRVPADLPHPWPALLTAMTSTDPENRPTATHVANTLRSTVLDSPPEMPVAQAVADPPLADDPPLVDDPPEPEPRRHSVLLLAPVVLLAIIGAAAYLVLRPGSPHDAPPPHLAPTTTAPSLVRQAPHTSRPAAPGSDAINTVAATQPDIRTSPTPSRSATPPTTPAAAVPPTPSAPAHTPPGATASAAPPPATPTRSPSAPPTSASTSAPTPSSSPTSTPTGTPTP